MNKLFLCVAMLCGTTAANAVPAVWESDYGTALTYGDDVTANGTLNFAFPFFGTGYSSYNASTNGFVSLGSSNGSGCCSGDANILRSGAPRIAPQWFDWVGTVYVNTAVAGRAVFTWSGTEYGAGGSYTTQAQLFDTGAIIFGFDGPGAVTAHTSLTGLSAAGGAADPGGSELTDASFSTGSNQSFYQLFGAKTFDLNQTNLFITPNAQGGVNVSSVSASAGAVPEPATWTLLIGGFFLVGATMRRRVAIIA